MPLFLSLWRHIAGRFGRSRSEAGFDEARRRALRSVTLEQLRHSDWPCHPHF